MRKKLVALVVGLALMFGVTVGVTAAPILEKISANFDWSIKFKLNGKDWTPVGQDGKKLAPIIYQGATYLPVRAIGESLDIAVDWDDKNRTVILGERLVSLPIVEEKIDHSYATFSTVDKAYTVQNGTDYKSGIVMEGLNSSNKSVKLVPNNKYQTVQLEFFGLNQENYRIQIKKEDGTVLKDLSLSPNSLSSSVTVDIGGVKELTISASSKLGGKEDLFFTGSYK